MLMSGGRRIEKQGENRGIAPATDGNENKLLTSWYKLLTNGRHIAGIKPRAKNGLDQTEIEVCHLV
jgi:hypothetical protein